MVESHDSQGTALVVVEWEDATCRLEWHDEAELREFASNGAWKVVNVGYLIHEDADCLVLAARYAPTINQSGLIERIPKRAVIRTFALTHPGFKHL